MNLIHCLLKMAHLGNITLLHFLLPCIIRESLSLCHLILILETHPSTNPSAFLHLWVTIHFIIYKQFEWEEGNSWGQVIMLNCMVVLNKTNYCSIKLNAQIELSFNYFSNNKYQLKCKCAIISSWRKELRYYFPRLKYN